LVGDVAALRLGQGLMNDFFSVAGQFVGVARDGLRWVGCLAVCTVLIGCEDPNEMFHGLWESTATSSEAPYEGAPLIALGHYGLEVTGVAYFHQAIGQSKLVSDCPCAFVVHQGVDLDEKVVRFSTSFEAMPCEGDGTDLDWELVLGTDPLTEDKVFEGSVTSSDGSLAAFDVKLRRISRYISPAHRLCPPEDL
jgi:hypothetical protein